MCKVQQIVISVLILIFSWSALGLERHAPFNKIDISTEDMNILVNASQSATQDEFLQKINDSFNELKIIILPASKALPFPSVINWSQDSTPLLNTQWYLKNFNRLASPTAAGMFIGPFETGVELQGRPMASSPILLVRKNVPMHVLQHEVIHYLIYRARVLKVGAPTELGIQSQLSQTIDLLLNILRSNQVEPHNFKTIAEVEVYTYYQLATLDWLSQSDLEEVDVVTIMLANKNELRISQEGGSSQFIYMLNNLDNVARKFQAIRRSKLALQSAQAKFGHRVTPYLESLSLQIEEFSQLLLNTSTQANKFGEELEMKME